MNVRSTVSASILAVSALCARPALADDRADFGDEVKKATGEYTSKYIVENLMTFKIGAKCWAKLHDDKTWGIHQATFFVRDVAAYAKRASDDDWNAMETANNSDRENNKAGVEQSVKEFASKFSFTMSDDGDDCDATGGGMLMRYWTTVGDSLQYLTGKKPVKIVLAAVPKKKSKDVTVKVSGSTITITAPRDFEAAGWSDKIADGIKKSKL